MGIPKKADKFPRGGMGDGVPSLIVVSLSSNTNLCGRFRFIFNIQYFRRENMSPAPPQKTFCHGKAPFPLIPGGSAIVIFKPQGLVRFNPAI